MAETAFSKLNAKQRRCVTLYTSEGKSETYLNRIASYRACYSVRTLKNAEQAAYRLFKRQDIRDAIKELLPPLAYDTYFISKEYKDHYDEAREEGKRKDCLLILKEMAAHTGMLQKKQDTREESQDRKDLSELTAKINKNFRERSQEMKERQNGTDSN